jgi:type II secretory pathway pseudopilin PulG
VAPLARIANRRNAMLIVLLVFACFGSFFALASAAPDLQFGGVRVRHCAETHQRCQQFSKRLTHHVACVLCSLRQAASGVLDTPAQKRQKTQATDAVAELHRRAGLSLGVGVSGSSVLGAGNAGLGLGNGRAPDEFGDDPLDEWSYIQREEEQKLAAAKERAALLAQQQKEQAAQQAAGAAAQAAAAAATAAQSAASAPPHPANLLPAALGGGGSAAAAPTAIPAQLYIRPPPNRPPPPGYKCHNCGQPGHWKQACPTAAHLSAPNIQKLIDKQHLSVLSPCGTRWYRRRAAGTRLGTVD